MKDSKDVKVTYQIWIHLWLRNGLVCKNLTQMVSPRDIVGERRIYLWQMQLIKTTATKKQSKTNKQANKRKNRVSTTHLSSPIYRNLTVILWLLCPWKYLSKFY